MTLAVFVALGLGMALPYALLAWFPGWRRMLPRPGAWMERLKQVLAFPLYATVAWLIWVLGAQLDNDAVVRLLVTLVIVAFGAVVVAALSRRHGPRWGAAAAVAVVSRRRRRVAAGARRRHRGAAGRGVRQRRTLARVHADGRGGPGRRRPSGVRRLHRGVVRHVPGEQAAGPERSRRSATRSRSRGVELVRADWTRRDPVITRALAALGRQGVPVYVLYRPGKEPLVLPEILKKQTVLDALATLGTRADRDAQLICQPHRDLLTEAAMPHSASSVCRCCSRWPAGAIARARRRPTSR